MQRRSTIIAIVAILAVTGLGYSAWRYFRERGAESCQACMRPVHAHMKTVALVNDKREIFCCPACALSAHQQSGKPVQVVELTDYLNNTPLKPADSYLVRNSDVNPCLQHHPAVGENNQPLESHFDRCSPSVLAFQDQRSAAAFASEHGGQVTKYSDFAAEFQR